MRFPYSTAFKRAAAAATTTIVFATPLFAQNPPAGGPTCDIDESKPQAVARATFSITRAQSALKTGNAGKDLRDVVALLNAPASKNENPVARAYLLGQAYILLLDQAGVTPITTRSAIGLTTDPNGTIDLFAAADSAWSIVEASAPGCVPIGKQWRQQKAWLAITNQAINAVNANKFDSAEIYARRALILDRSAPYAYSVLASVAKSKKDYPKAAEYWKKTLEAAGTDTTFSDVRDRALFDIAATATTRADAASPAEKKALAREAINAWNAVAGTATDDNQQTFAIQNLAKLYVTAGDSISIGKIYAPVLANPARYGEQTLMQAGVIASQFKHHDEAARIFSAVLERNPYQRDGLNNLAAQHIFLNQFDKVFPLVTRLTNVDPSNPDNWMLNAYAYAGLVKATKPGKLNKQYTDSLVLYTGKADKLSVKVSFIEFSRSSEATQLVGTIENRGTTAKTYPLAVDFLDSKGQVVSTETVTVGPVPAKGSKEFTIKSAKGGVSAFRYKPVS
jgi:tetratricopeptide (TPR) repeat protein